MDDGSRDTPTVPGRPFALLVAPGAPSTVAALEAGFRHMGLRPEIVAAEEGDAPCFRLRLGSLEVLAGRGGAARLDLAAPEDRATSLIGVTLPSAWREHCWFFELEDGPGPTPLANTRFDDFYRMLVLLIDLLGAQQLFWSPARLWSDAAQFRCAIAEMQASGMPPVLHLVAFRRREDVGGSRVATRGLASFAGQELEAVVPPGWDMAAMVQRLARLALDMLLNGPLARAQHAPGLNSGEWVAMTPRGGASGGPATVLVEFSFER